jgi:hypothetical protein
MGLFGILLGLALLIWLAFRGWSVLLLAPAAALLAAAAAGEPLLAHWTQTFMGGAARFLAQFFPLFLLGALFGKAIAGFMTERLGPERAVLAVVLAGALVTSSDGRYGGSSPRADSRGHQRFRAEERSSLFASMSECDLQTRRKCAPSLGWKN